MEHLDDGIGRVLATLRETGLEQNTLVVFTADNGGSLPHGQNNGPWRGGKHDHYDGGLRVPFMVRWPSRIKPESRCDYAGLNFDLFPTFLELAGAKPSTELDVFARTARVFTHHDVQVPTCGVSRCALWRGRYSTGQVYVGNTI